MGQKNFQLRLLGTAMACSWTWASVGDAISFVPVASIPPPVFTVSPSISGTPEVGATLTLSRGTVTGGTISGAELLRDGVVIDADPGDTYLLAVADEGAQITLRVAATGDGGTVFATSTAVGPVAEGMPSGLEVGATSLKFATSNLTAAGNTSVLKQATTGLTNVCTADDSFMVMRIYVDQDRLLRNVLFGLMGNTFFSTTNGRFTLLYYPKASADATRRQRFVLVMRRISGSQYVVLSNLMPEVSGWYDLWVRRAAGGVFTLDAYRVGDGVRVADGTATALTQPLAGVDTFATTHFYIGDAVEVSAEATTATARPRDGNGVVGWDGAMAFVGIGDAAVSNADCEAIAQGADPFVRIAASAYKYARRFGFAAGAPTGLGPVAGATDTTAAATVIGSFVPGGTPGRQGQTDYITLDPVPDYRGFGVDPTTLAATVPFTGLCGGVPYSGTITALLLPDFRYRREVRFFGGQVQGRFISEAGVPVAAWQTVASTAATGVTTGQTFTENSRSAPAIKVLVNGQSQMTIWNEGATLGNTLADPAVSISRQERGAASPNPLAFQTVPDFGNLRVSDGLVEFAKVIRAARGGSGAVQVVLNALNGSGVVDMLDNWSRTAGGLTLDTEDLLAYAGNDVTIDLWQWFTNDQGQGGNFGNILDAAYNGTGPLATANKLPDIRAATAKVVISPATRQAPTAAGPLDADPNQIIGAIRPAMWAWAAANGATIGPEITDMRLAAGEGPHQDPTSPRGNMRIGTRLAEAVNRAIGTSASVDPTIGSPQFVAGKAAFTLAVTLPNAGSTLRVDNTATFGSNVQGFEISTDGGTTWSRSGFTATFAGTTVTLTKSSGDWSGVAAGALRVRYATGAPFGFGTSVESSELFRGGLYDGTALEGGLGLPVRPMAPAVVAEP